MRPTFRKLAQTSVTYAVLVSVFIACGQGMSPNKIHREAKVSGNPDPSGAELMITSVSKEHYSFDYPDSTALPSALAFTIYDGGRKIPALEAAREGESSNYTAQFNFDATTTYEISAMCPSTNCSEAMATVTRYDRKTQSTRQNSFLIKESEEYGVLQLVEARMGTNFLDPYQAWASFTGNYD